MFNSTLVYCVSSAEALLTVVPKTSLDKDPAGELPSEISYGNNCISLCPWSWGHCELCNQAKLLVHVDIRNTQEPIGDTYSEGTALPGKSWFWFPRLGSCATCSHVLLPSPTRRLGSGAGGGGGGGTRNLPFQHLGWVYRAESWSLVWLSCSTGQEKVYSSLACSPSRWLTSGTQRRRKQQREAKVSYHRKSLGLEGTRRSWEKAFCFKSTSTLQGVRKYHQCSFPRRRMTLGEYGTCLTSD